MKNYPCIVDIVKRCYSKKMACSMPLTTTHKLKKRIPRPLKRLIKILNVKIEYKYKLNPEDSTLADCEDHYGTKDRLVIRLLKGRYRSHNVRTRTLAHELCHALIRRINQKRFKFMGRKEELVCELYAYLLLHAINFKYNKPDRVPRNFMDKSSAKMIHEAYIAALILTKVTLIKIGRQPI